MRISIFLLIILMLPVNALAFSNLWQSKCEQKEWTQEDSRTQGGGWIWFPGKGVDSSLELATLKAEGSALNMLVKECQFPHKEIKIHERCEEKSGNDYRVFVRVSLLEKQCKESRYAKKDKVDRIKNKALAATHRKYKKYLRGLKQIEDDCSEESAKKCYQMGKHAYFMGEKESAFKFFDTACQKGHSDSCFNAGVAKYYSSDIDAAKGYFLMVCKKKDSMGCLFYGHVMNKLEQIENMEKYYEKACDLNNAQGCFSLAKHYEESNEERLLAAKYFNLACERELKEACQDGSSYFLDNGNKERATSFAKRACDLKEGKGCFNYFHLTKKKNKKKAASFLKKSCDYGIGVGCFQAAKNSNKKSALKLFERGCDSGHAKSCSEAATLLFDKKNKKRSLLYSKLACKLGINKSCHNSGFLEYENGNKDQAKIFLERSCDHGISQSCALLKKI